MDEVDKAAYDAAMEENILPGAVLDDLKWAGSYPASVSNRRKCELGERSGRETGLPLRSITAFLGIPESSHEYHRARLGRDRDRTSGGAGQGSLRGVGPLPRPPRGPRAAQEGASPPARSASGAS